MHPKEYYNNQFRKDLERFVSEVNNGRGLNPGMFVPVTPQTLFNVRRSYDDLFFAALSCGMLIDQLVYSHFSEHSKRFKEETMFPQLEWSLAGPTYHPWEIGRHCRDMKVFKEFASFFASYLKDFFDNKFSLITWKEIKIAMLSDPNILYKKYGFTFMKAVFPDYNKNSFIIMQALLSGVL